MCVCVKVEFSWENFRNIFIYWGNYYKPKTIHKGAVVVMA